MEDYNDHIWSEQFKRGRLLRGVARRRTQPNKMTILESFSMFLDMAILFLAFQICLQGISDYFDHNWSGLLKRGRFLRGRGKGAYPTKQNDNIGIFFYVLDMVN